MIRIRVRLPNGSATLNCSSDITIQGLVSMIKTSTSPPLECDALDILTGYPLVKLECDMDDLVSKYITNGDTIAVKLCEDVTLIPSASVKVPSGGGSKRRVTSQAVPVNQTKTKVAKLSFGANIHSLNKKKPPAKKKAKSSGSSSESPFCKTNGDAVGAAAGPHRRRSNLTMSSEEDIGTNLLSAVAGESGKKNRFLRSVFSRAVELEYDRTKAQARVTSLLSGKYSLEPSQNARTLNSGESTVLHVKFHKGAGNRSYHYETVELLSAGKLKAVIGLVLADDDIPRVDDSSSSSDNTTLLGITKGNVVEWSSSSSSAVVPSESEGPRKRDLLRPSHMAGCSPRVFWSLVYIYGPNIPFALQQLLPDKDWSWMVQGGSGDGEGRRDRVLSEKARENRRQLLEQAEEKERKKLLACMKANSAGHGDVAGGEMRHVRGGDLLAVAESDASVNLIAKNLDENSRPSTASTAHDRTSHAEFDICSVDSAIFCERHCRSLLENICPHAVCIQGLDNVLLVDNESSSSSRNISDVSGSSGSATGSGISYVTLVLALADIPVVTAAGKHNSGKDSAADGDDDYTGELLSMVSMINRSMDHIVSTSASDGGGNAGGKWAAVGSSECGGECTGQVSELLTASISEHRTSLPTTYMERHPFVTVSHMKYWIVVCRTYIMQCFWREVSRTLLQGLNWSPESTSSSCTIGLVSNRTIASYMNYGSEKPTVYTDDMMCDSPAFSIAPSPNSADTRPAIDMMTRPLQALKEMGNIHFPRDLALWRNNVSDLIAYLYREIQTQNDANIHCNLSAGQHSSPVLLPMLRTVCLLAHSMRERFDWIDKHVHISDIDAFLSIHTQQYPHSKPPLQVVNECTTQVHQDEDEEWVVFSVIRHCWYSSPLTECERLSTAWRVTKRRGEAETVIIAQRTNVPLPDAGANADDAMKRSIVSACNDGGGSGENTDDGAGEEDIWVTLADVEPSHVVKAYGLLLQSVLAIKSQELLVKQELSDDVEMVVATPDDVNKLGRVVILPTTMNDDGDCEDESGENSTRSSDIEKGIIIGYLAATTVEPMALWKVHLESGGYQDIEEHEVVSAET